MAGAVPCDAALCVSYLEEIMANIKEIEALTNAFGPSGFEDEVIREVKNWCGGLDVVNDAMYNVYALEMEIASFPGRTQAEGGGW